ncbi:MAG: hypothetical protein AB7O26_06450, partial [Planctomycetaceae bacterium]
MRFFERKRVLRRAKACLLSATVLASAAFAYSGVLADNPGLVGIFGTEPPDDLIAESFSTLDGNWQKWGEELGAEVARLYAGEAKDIGAQRKALGGLRAKVAVIDKALADSRYRSIHDALFEVRGKLVRRLDIADAVLDTLEQKPEDVKAARLKGAVEDVVDALDTLEDDLHRVVGGSAWLPYVGADGIRKALKENKPTDPAIATSISRLKAVESIQDAKQKQFLSRPTFTKLADALGRLQTVGQAETKPADADAVRNSLVELVSAMESYEASNLAEDAAAVKTAFENAAKVTTDGGSRLRSALRLHYTNFNLQVVASESFLSKIARREQTDAGPVRDFILGANVSGNQQTSTVVTIDLKPSSTNAYINMLLDGTTRSSTAGVTEKATIFTQGNHNFRALKPVTFDGRTLSSGSAQMVYVDPNNTTVGAETKASGMPLFGALTERMAMRVAGKKRPESEAIAAQRLQARVVPQLDTRLDDEVAKANNRLQGETKKRLQDNGLYPERVRVRTSEGFMRYSSLIANPNELSGDVPNALPNPSRGVIVHVHESLLNNAVDRMKFAGRTMTDDDIRAEIERFATALTGREFKFEQNKDANAEDKTSTLVFAEKDPVRIRIEGGNVNLIMRAGFKQEGKEDIPTQIVTVPLAISVNGDKILIDRGVVQVAPAGPS